MKIRAIYLNEDGSFGMEMEDDKGDIWWIYNARMTGYTSNVGVPHSALEEINMTYDYGVDNVE